MSSSLFYTALFLIISESAISISSNKPFKLLQRNIIYGDTIPQKSDRVPDTSSWFIYYVDIQASIKKKVWKKYLETELQKAIKDSSFKKIKPGTYTVRIKFQISKDGAIEDATAINNSPIELTRPCIKIIENGPRWQPAMSGGKLVTFYITQAITFIVEEDDCNMFYQINCSL